MQKYIFVLFVLLAVSGCTMYHDSTAFQNPTPTITITAEATFTPLSKLTATADLRDDGLFTQIPCGPPCFNGIVPGVTTEEELYEQLDTNPALAPCMKFDRTNKNGNRGIYCVSASIGVDETGFVETIIYEPKNVRVKQVVEKYGNPDKVSVALRSLPDSPIRYSMELCYDKYPMMVYLPEKLGEPYFVTEDTFIESIRYEIRNNYNLFCSQNSFNLIRDWKGYGNY